MPHGGYHPFPKRFGGNKHSGKPLLEVVHNSINAQRGAAFDTSDTTSIVWIETMAWARAITFDGWGTNERLAMQWDPRRTTDMLPRWEGIFKTRPAPDASDRSRRAVLLSRWQRFGGLTNHARMTTALAAELGDYFVALEYISLAHAVVHAPDGSYPWGTVVADVPWYSTVAHFLIRLQKPTGATEAQFYEAAGKVVQILDPIASAFVTFDWYRAPASGVTIAVSGGPSGAGFYLDDEHNLDNNVFDAMLSIAAVSPNTGPAFTDIVITGTGFLLATDVRLAGFSLGVWAIVDDNTITATTSAAGPGATVVAVEDMYGSIDTIPFTIT